MCGGLIVGQAVNSPWRVRFCFVRGCQLPILGRNLKRLLRFCQPLCYHSFMKKIIVGLDFDGVVAYNPARLARLPIAVIKRYILGIDKVSFFVPKTPLQRSLWALAHESSMFPARGAAMLRKMTREHVIEAHLVTSRFAFLEPNLHRFLTRWNLLDCFTSITLNTREEQAHTYKERIIREKKFDYYVEDNWDIVSHLQRKHLKTEIHWIYNILDRGRRYPRKHPYLEQALAAIINGKK